MPAIDEIPPQLSPNVVLQPLDEDGRHVVKNRAKRTYLQLGRQESFLLQQLDGNTPSGEIIASFERRFSEQISPDELNSFVAMAAKEGLVKKKGEGDEAHDLPTDGSSRGIIGLVKLTYRQAQQQSPLFFRVSLYDPDQFLNWLEPRTRWLFSRKLAIAAGVGVLLALLLIWTNRDHLVSQFATQLNWKTLALAWITTILVSVCHEFGHGLACKRYGGDVREMGALWIFFTPCLYCNVSDTWLQSSKWRRLLVSLAGTYVDLLIFVVAVFVWWVTASSTAVNYVAWIIVSTCGLRVAFNLNPLMRLDGYYALSDFLAVHNLRKRARSRWMEYVRWLLWGAERPQPVADGRALLWYGIANWFFAVGFLNLIYFKVTDLLQGWLGVAGFLGGTAFFAALAKRYFKGSLGGEFTDMLRTRRKRVLLFAGIAAAILLAPIYDRVSGPFQVRSRVHKEVRAPVAGFIREVLVAEGDEVEPGALLARIEVPELASEITRKQAEIHEVEATLRRLEAGPRPEQVDEQEQRVQRAIAWKELAERDLVRARLSLQEELARMDLQIAQADSELDYRNTVCQQAQQLFDRGGLAGKQLLAEKKRRQVAESQLRQAEAAIRARQAAGVLTYEAELARREKELADTRASLSLLKAGTRPEEIEAERARLQRLTEEAKHLYTKRDKQAIVSLVAGTVTTPRLHEKIGQFLDKGAVVCLIEDLGSLEAEIAVPEQNANTLVPGQSVSLKPRALPFHRLKAKVDRIAPSALGAVDKEKSNQSQSTVTVYCQLENHDGLLRTGMTGFGRIYHRFRPVGMVVANRAIRFLRTEFWW